MTTPAPTRSGLSFTVTRRSWADKYRPITGPAVPKKNGRPTRCLGGPAAVHVPPRQSAYTRVDSSLVTGSVTPALVTRAFRWIMPAAVHLTVTLYTASAFGASRGSGSNTTSVPSTWPLLDPAAALNWHFSGSVHTTFTSVSVTDPVFVTRIS